MANRTALYERHREAGARMVDFAGWDMPIDYGSQIAEHNAVRADAGMFDVSHMTQVDLEGAGAEPFLRLLCANDVARAHDGQALYTCLLNETAGVIDDGIVYRLGPERYRLVVNAATRDKDWAWIERHAADFEVECTLRDDRAMIAVQGPNARARVHAALPALADGAAHLARFYATGVDGTLIARTGYTGEDGYEVMLPASDAG
ncbi:MAG: glycine cleavage system aminomethyltransferase GcvT, partial [Halofilum sp. (in: g-proteobacteria)]